MYAVVRKMALLLLLTGARTDASRHSSECSGANYTRPTISAASANTKSDRYSTNVEIFLKYGENFTVYCTASDSSKLTIEYNKQCLRGIQLNSTTVQLSLGELNAGVYTYNCTDVGTGCGESLVVTIRPKITVLSPDGVLYTNGVNSYFVLRGQNYEVYCSSNVVENLYMSTSWNGKVLQTERVNKTTIKYKSRTAIVGEWSYFCHDNISELFWSVMIEENYYPEGHNFQCISNSARNLECSWSTFNKKNDFNLYKIQGRLETLLCHEDSRTSNRVCTFNVHGRIYNLGNLHIELLLQSCNAFVCCNETFTVNLNSILKLDPPAEFRVLDVSSQGASVAWSTAEGTNWVVLVYKLEYRRLGAGWQQANTSLVLCVQSKKYWDWNKQDCKFRLNLNCPDSHYEIRVYVKPAVATHDGYWSEPATLFFFTKPQETGAVTDPACNLEFKEPKPLPSAEDILYELRQLISYERKMKLALRTQINRLNEKKDKIKELMGSLNKV